MDSFEIKEYVSNNKDKIKIINGNQYIKIKNRIYLIKNIPISNDQALAANKFLRSLSIAENKNLSEEQLLSQFNQQIQEHPYDIFDDGWPEKNENTSLPITDKNFVTNYKKLLKLLKPVKGHNEYRSIIIKHMKLNKTDELKLSNLQAIDLLKLLEQRNQIIYDRLIKFLDEHNYEIPITASDLISIKGEGFKKNGGLYDDEIDDIARLIFSGKIFKYIGTLMSDEILEDKYINEIKKNINKKNPIGGILNTDKIGMPGTHWVAWFWDGKTKYLEYYNSFGNAPFDDFNKLAKKLNMDVKYNLDNEQNNASVNCGYFSLNFIYSRLYNIPFEEATDKTPIEGEKEINKFKKIIKKLKTDLDKYESHDRI